MGGFLQPLHSNKSKELCHQFLIIGYCTAVRAAVGENCFPPGSVTGCNRAMRSNGLQFP